MGQPNGTPGLARAHVDIGAVEAGGFLVITDIRDAGTQLDISFTTEAGWPHHLESRDALVPTVPWAPVPDSARTGNGAVLTVPVPRPPPATNRFYRAVLNP